MAKITYEQVDFNKVCDLISENHKYTKKYINENKGDYPVYSATIGSPYGYINTFDFSDIDMFCVVNYGNSGKTFKIEDEKFSIGRNISGVTIKSEFKDSIDLEYIRITTEPIFIERAKGSKQKNLNQRLIKSIKISIPVNTNGEYDKKVQEEIVKKHEMIKVKKKEIKRKLSYINDVEVDILENIVGKSVLIDFEELFTIERGKVISKPYINNHKGDYPVYSTQLDEAFGHIDTYIMMENI